MWWAGSLLGVAGYILLTGGLRPGLGGQLVSSPRFVAEVLAGLLCGGIAVRSFVTLASPGAAGWGWTLVPILPLSLWTAMMLVGLEYPASEPSMLGKREGCYYETLALGLLPMAAGFWIVARRLPLARAWAGGVISVASASLPAFLMQIACMYDPAHILSHHLLPIAILAAVGAIAGPILLKRV